MKMRHKPVLVDLVTWDGSDAALRELLSLGLDGHRFEATAGNPIATLVIPSPEGDQHVLPGWSAVRRVGANTGWRSVGPDDVAAVYEPIEAGAA